MIRPRNAYDTTNLLFLQWIAHFRGQVNKTEVEARPRPLLYARGRGHNFSLNITDNFTMYQRHRKESALCDIFSKAVHARELFKSP